MTLGIRFDDAIDSFHIQILMKVVISNVPRGIHDTTEYTIPESLYQCESSKSPASHTILPADYI
jgi:hypothetical protein